VSSGAASEYGQFLLVQVESYLLVQVESLLGSAYTAASRMSLRSSTGDLRDVEDPDLVQHEEQSHLAQGHQGLHAGLEPSMGQGGGGVENNLTVGSGTEVGSLPPPSPGYYLPRGIGAERLRTLLEQGGTTQQFAAGQQTQAPQPFGSQILQPTTTPSGGIDDIRNTGYNADPAALLSDSSILVAVLERNRLLEEALLHLNGRLEDLEMRPPRGKDSPVIDWSRTPMSPGPTPSVGPSLPMAGGQPAVDTQSIGKAPAVVAAPPTGDGIDPNWRQIYHVFFQLQVWDNYELQARFGAVPLTESRPLTPLSLRGWKDHVQMMKQWTCEISDKEFKSYQLGRNLREFINCDLALQARSAPFAREYIYTAFLLLPSPMSKLPAVHDLFQHLVNEPGAPNNLLLMLYDFGLETKAVYHAFKLSCHADTEGPDSMPFAGLERLRQVNAQESAVLATSLEEATKAFTAANEAASQALATATAALSTVRVVNGADPADLAEPLDDLAYCPVYSIGQLPLLLAVVLLLLCCSPVARRHVDAIFPMVVFALSAYSVSVFGTSVSDVCAITVSLLAFTVRGKAALGQAITVPVLYSAGFLLQVATFAVQQTAFVVALLNHYWFLLRVRAADSSWLSFVYDMIEWTGVALFGFLTCTLFLAFCQFVVLPQLIWMEPPGQSLVVYGSTSSSVRVLYARSEATTSEDFHNADAGFVRMSLVCSSVLLFIYAVYCRSVTFVKDTPPRGWLLAFVICLSMNVGVPRHALVIDSGCTSHMVNPDTTTCVDPTSVRNFEQEAMTAELGGKVKFTEKGSLRFLLPGHGSTVLSPQDVFFSRHIQVNLLSVPCLVAHGWKCVLDRQCAYIEHSGIRHHLQQAANGLWYLPMPARSALSAAERKAQKAAVSHLAAPTTVAGVQAPPPGISIEELFHLRLGHASYDKIHLLKKAPEVVGMGSFGGNTSRCKCHTCQSCKSKPPSRPTSRTWTDKDLARDDARHPAKANAPAPGERLSFDTRINSESYNRIRTVFSDNAGEYLSHAFRDFCASLGINPVNCPPNTSRLNGQAERMLRELQTKARCMLHFSGLSKSFWELAILYAALVHNVLPTRAEGVSISSHGRTAIPDQLFFDNPTTGVKHTVDMGLYKVFGSTSWARHARSLDTDTKLDPRAFRGIWVGLATNFGKVGDLVYDPDRDRVLVSADVTYDETFFLARKPTERRYKFGDFTVPESGSTDLASCSDPAPESNPFDSTSGGNPSSQDAAQDATQGADDQGAEGDVQGASEDDV